MQLIWVNRITKSNCNPLGWLYLFIPSFDVSLFLVTHVCFACKKSHIVQCTFCFISLNSNIPLLHEVTNLTVALKLNWTLNWTELNWNFAIYKFSHMYIQQSKIPNMQCFTSYVGYILNYILIAILETLSTFLPSVWTD